MSNIRELLVNVVIQNKPKMLRGLDQKVRGMDRVLMIHPTQSVIPPAERQALTHLVKAAEHGKPNCLRLMAVGDP
jgi:hypothetical protein